MSTETKKTKFEIAMEVLPGYFKNPETRAVGPDEACRYFDKKTGNMCAVGKCLKNPQKHADTIAYAGDFFEEFGKDELKDEYQGHDDSFWIYLQRCHDESKIGPMVEFLTEEEFEKLEDACHG